MEQNLSWIIPGIKLDHSWIQALFCLIPCVEVSVCWSDDDDRSMFSEKC